MAAEWYVLKIYSGHDKKIVQVLEKELELNKVSDQVEDIIVPVETIVEMKDGKKKEKTKVFFPGYVLIKMELNLKTKHAVLNSPGIVNFVGSKNHPQPLRDNEVTRILKRVDDSNNEEYKEKISVPFKVGDSIRVIDGPFNDFKGFVEDARAFGPIVPRAVTASPTTRRLESPSASTRSTTAGAARAPNAPIAMAAAARARSSVALPISYPSAGNARMSSGMISINAARTIGLSKGGLSIARIHSPASTPRLID